MEYDQTWTSDYNLLPVKMTKNGFIKLDDKYYKPQDLTFKYMSPFGLVERKIDESLFRKLLSDKLKKSVGKL